MREPCFADVEAAARLLDGIAHRTPVATSRTLDQRVGAAVVLKCENLQRAGAFKFRGAYNALSRLAPEERRRGVVTFSSGNHAQALALAGRLLGVPVTVVMPQDAPRTKRRATEGYGAEVVAYDPTRARRDELAQALQAERGLVLIPPYDHPDVIAGQGTATLELLTQAGPLGCVLAPCGGGGLLSGTALAASGAGAGCRVIGIEPALADDAVRSFRTGRLHTVHNPPTIADGTRTPSLGTLTFPLIRRWVHDMQTVTEEAIAEAVRFLFHRLKLVVEPSGALGVAALLSGAVAPTGRVGVIVSGGNVDGPTMARILEGEGEEAR
jgi:threonine dehydratase